MSLVSFYTPWNRQKTSSFLMFLGGIERYQWNEIGYLCWSHDRFPTVKEIINFEVYLIW